MVVQLTGVLLAAVLLAGCGGAARGGKAAPPQATGPGTGAVGESTTTTPVAPITNTDACATRLHDLCEPLLFYYLKNHNLPPRLEDLQGLPGFEGQVDLRCPVSHLPYVYNPAGILTAESRARIIAYDAAPSHSGMRWAISIIEPEDNGPLIARVVALPESHFQLSIPGAK
jgi:hypothetical protein